MERGLLAIFFLVIGQAIYWIAFIYSALMSRNPNSRFHDAEYRKRFRIIALLIGLVLFGVSYILAV